jgi:hypothetical protein
MVDVHELNRCQIQLLPHDCRDFFISIFFFYLRLRLLTQLPISNQTTTRPYKHGSTKHQQH